jgi:hypothetical protein
MRLESSFPQPSPTDHPLLPNPVHTNKLEYFLLGPTIGLSSAEMGRWHALASISSASGRCTLVASTRASIRSKLVSLLRSKSTKPESRYRYLPSESLIAIGAAYPAPPFRVILYSHCTFDAIVARWPFAGNTGQGTPRLLHKDVEATPHATTIESASLVFAFPFEIALL